MRDEQRQKYGFYEESLHTQRQMSEVECLLGRESANTETDDERYMASHNG